jgi:hypothetical protein
MNDLVANPTEKLSPYPATLPLEIALRVAHIRELCAEYNLTREEWEELRLDPVFQADVKRAVDRVKQEGMSVRLKAQLQSEELLKTNWRMIHDPTIPASVRADLSKFTFRVAGLSEPPKESAGPAAPTFAIQINL